MQQNAYNYCKKLKENWKEKILLNFPKYSGYTIFILCSLLLIQCEEKNGILQHMFAIQVI